MGSCDYWWHGFGISKKSHGSGMKTYIYLRWGKATLHSLGTDFLPHAISCSIQIPEWADGPRKKVPFLGKVAVKDRQLLSVYFWTKTEYCTKAFRYCHCLVSRNPFKKLEKQTNRKGEELRGCPVLTVINSYVLHWISVWSISVCPVSCLAVPWACHACCPLGGCECGF